MVDILFNTTHCKSSVGWWHWCGYNDIQEENVITVRSTNHSAMKENLKLSADNTGVQIIFDTVRNIQKIVHETNLKLIEHGPNQQRKENSN